jgi:glycine/D-amino acid oxidase-like deaminating enzyme
VTHERPRRRFTRRRLLLGTGAALTTAGLGIGLGAWAVSGSPRLFRSQVPRGRYVPAGTELPPEADVVVVGGGIAGICSALFLQDRGMRVVVCEKGYVAAEQSSRAYGWILSNGWHPDKVPMANRGKSIWQGMSERLGTDVGYRRSGNMQLFVTDEEIAQAETWIKQARAQDPDLDSKIVSGSELDALLPHGRGRFRAALYQASDGTAEPSYSPALIAEGAKAAGVQIIAPCAARAIESAAGHVSHVITEAGAIATKYAVIAGGAWSSLFCGNLGIYFPQLATITSSMQRVVVSEGPPGSGGASDYSWRRQADGEYSVLGSKFFALITRDSVRMLADFLPTFRHTDLPLRLRFGGEFFESLRVPHRWAADEISPFERARVLTADYDREALDIILSRLSHDFPAFASAKVKERWGGLIDVTPDSMPVVSPLPAIPGLFLCSGFSGSGLTMGPAAGELIAQMIAGEKTTLDPTLYRYSRFSDGTKLTVRN